jgi:MATE family, multidrug efflux pump
MPGRRAPTWAIANDVMQDLTQGPVARQVVAMAVPIAVGMTFQTLYYLIDLYFVGRLGEHAIAGVSTAGNLTFVVMALTQVLAVGTGALVAQAVGRGDVADANVVFNQSLSLSALLAVATLAAGYALAPWYMRGLAADAATVAAGSTYIHWYLPGLALQFAIVSMAAALRGTGIVKPAMFVQVLTVLLNAALAPVLIGGWGTGLPLGVTGAGLATTLALATGVVVLAWYFVRLEHTVAVQGRLLRVRLREWGRILQVGLPAGAEFLLMFVYLGMIYVVIARFGAEAQAGFGIGQRMMQSMFLPVMAIAFAAAPVAGQNFGAGDHDRVRATFRFAALCCSALMLLMTVVAHWQPATMIGAFSDDAAVVATGVEFLRYISWNFVASGLIFTCSGLFQALGNTLPVLLSSGSRLLTFAVPLLLLAQWPGLQLHHVWSLSVATVAAQALISLWLLRREFRAKLRPAGVQPDPVTLSTATK